MKLVGRFLGKNMPVITGDATKYNCTKPFIPSVQEKGHRETEQTKITENYIRKRIKIKQDTWQPFNDKWSDPIDTGGIFLSQYGLIVSLSVQNGFKSAFLVVLSLHR